jgi:methylase of polypeptide subunit release factors
VTLSTTEWEFTATVASWINQIIQANRDLPFSEARCEQKSEDSQKRRDLTLLDSNGKIVLTGEVKLPYRKDGGSPYNETVVQDARQKAIRAKSKYFFTWNVNECVLWETFTNKISRTDRKYTSWDVTHVINEHQLTIPATEHAIRKWLPLLLNDFAKILRGTAIFGLQTPDQKFVDAIESALKMPIHFTLESLASRYEKRFKAELDAWMRGEMGWVISDDSQDIQDNLERASKFACYALLNKLVFYEALLKRYGSHLSRLDIPEHIDTGDSLRLHLEGYFSNAKKVTGDYETVFGFSHNDIGNRIPFYSNHSIPYWRELITGIHVFDFSKLDYEVIGGIFERLISPDERHKYGQFYTSPDVVDLINSFCIRDGSETVMDPACGGGTFLVRAYARKRELNPSQKHSRLIADIYGVDVSDFATHLTTINLATRDLIDEENYPRIARSDFFNVRQKITFITLPDLPKGAKAKIKGLGTGQQREINIPPLDAIVGNPPYVRQEDIRNAKNSKQPEPGTKEYYQLLVKEEWKDINLSGRSDLHCYFWPHAATFLKDDGWLCLLTSSQWLDVEYGFRLQEWILNNFEIIAIFESLDEPWFVGARVATAATILRRQNDGNARHENKVRFVQLRKPIKELLGNDGTTAGAVAAANDLRDEIMSQKANTLNSRYRLRIVKQGDLWDQGVSLGAVMGEADKYYGGKWGLHLRAPDLWFDLIDRCGKNFSALGEIAIIRRGITSGKDSFFFPKDYSRDALTKYPNAKDFEAAYRVPRQEVESGEVSLILCGEGLSEVHPIESKYLESEIHSLMEIDGFTVTSADCSRKIILIDKKKKSLKGTYALQYIQWGESQNVHVGATCASRGTDEREWYDLTYSQRPDIVLPKIQQYRLISFLNPDNLYPASSLLGIYDLDKDYVKALCGILNSSVSIMSRILYARILGNEGNIQLDVYLAQMMLTPDIRKASSSLLLKIEKAFNRMSERKVLAFLSERRLREMSYRQKDKEDELEQLSNICELDMDDRHELDDAVLELIGLNNRKERKEYLDKLYRYLNEFFEWTRQKEEKAILNKAANSRRGKTQPSDIAKQIMTEIEERDQHLFKDYESNFLDSSKPFDTYDVPLEGIPEVFSDLFISTGVKFNLGRKKRLEIATRTETQARLLCEVTKWGIRGLVRIPYQEDECQKILNSYTIFMKQREDRIWQLIEERTKDEDIQQKIYEALITMLTKHA